MADRRQNRPLERWLKGNVLALTGMAAAVIIAYGNLARAFERIDAHISDKELHSQRAQSEALIDERVRLQIAPMLAEIEHLKATTKKGADDSVAAINRLESTIRKQHAEKKQEEWDQFMNRREP